MSAAPINPDDLFGPSTYVPRTDDERNAPTLELAVQVERAKMHAPTTAEQRLAAYLAAAEELAARQPEGVTRDAWMPGDPADWLVDPLATYIVDKDWRVRNRSDGSVEDADVLQHMAAQTMDFQLITQLAERKKIGQERLERAIENRDKANRPATAADRVDAEYYRLKTQQEAERRLAGESYAGSRVMSVADLEDIGAKYIIDDLLPERSVAFLVAKPNAGKTFAYVDLMCRAAMGMPWVGKTCNYRAKTLVVLGEAVSGFADRLKAWGNQHDVKLADLEPWLSFIDGANLNNDVSLRLISDEADRLEADLIVFDTWANVSGSTSEDDAALNAMTLNRAKSIRPAATLLFVHHPRKSEEDTSHPVMRGSSALAGAADVVMTMWEDKGFISKSGERRTWLALSTENQHGGKNRGAATETIRGLYLEDVYPARVFEQDETESMSKESRDVRKFLRGVMTAEEFGKAAGKSLSTAKRYLRKATAEGIALQSEAYGAYRYELAEPEPEQNKYAAAAAQRMEF